MGVRRAVKPAHATRRTATHKRAGHNRWVIRVCCTNPRTGNATPATTQGFSKDCVCGQTAENDRDDSRG
eukprot:6182843-Amphidinium_carterae.1